MARVTGAEGPDPIDLAVGITLRRVRKERGLSQHQVGAEIGVTFQQMQKYENGNNRISASMLVRAAKAMSVQPGDLLPRTDAAPLPASASLLSLRGADELLEGYAAIKSPRHRRAVLTLVRAMRAVDSAAASDREQEDGGDGE